MENERQIVELVSMDRLYIPLSSLEGKIKRTRVKQAKGIAVTMEDAGEIDYSGDRTYARIVEDDKSKARELKEAIREFVEEFPKYGSILAGKIAEKRVMREKYLYFGMQPNCKLTTDDYVDVMVNLGLTQGAAERLYPALMDFSRKLSKKRDGEERSVLVGSYEKK